MYHGALSMRLTVRQSDPMYSDADYVAGIQRGDETMFAALVHGYIRQLTQFAFGYTGEEDAAHDIVQDVFARVWLLGRDWNPTKGVTPYLFGAVRHRAYDVIRANRARERMQHVVRLDQDATLDDRDPYADPMLVAVVRRELHALTQRQQDALQLRYEQGHTLTQTAEILGIDVSAVKKLIARGITTLRVRLAEFQRRSQ